MQSRRRSISAFVVIGSVALVIAGAAGWLTASAIRNADQPAETGGLVVLGPVEHDFGEHRQDEVLSHVFSLVNKTAAPVKIIEVRTSCGCLVADRIEEPIAPGASVDLPIRFTTGAAQETASGTIQVGYRRVSGSAASSRPEYVILRVRANVTPDYRISPTEVDFGEVDGLAVQQATSIIRVLPAELPDVKISEVHCSGDFLKAKILPKTPDDPAIRVQVNFDGAGFTQSEAINGAVIFSTNSKRVPHALVPVRGKYNAPAEVEPKSIVITSSEQGEVERDLRLTTSQPARIRGIRGLPDSGVRVEGGNQPVAPEHILRVFTAPCLEQP